MVSIVPELVLVLILVPPPAAAAAAAADASASAAAFESPPPRACRESCSSCRRRRCSAAVIGAAAEAASAALVVEDAHGLRRLRFSAEPDRDKGRARGNPTSRPAATRRFGRPTPPSSAPSVQMAGVGCMSMSDRLLLDAMDTMLPLLLPWLLLLPMRWSSGHGMMGVEYRRIETVVCPHGSATMKVE